MLSRTALILLLAATTLFFTATADAYLYWTSEMGVGRAELDGSHVNEAYIAGFGGPWYDASIALDSHFIYWGESAAYGPSPVWAGTLDGTEIVELPLPATLGKLAVYGDQLFYSQWGGGIGRLDLTTGDVEADVIPPEYGALSGPVIYDGQLWWSDESGNRIGNADLDGSNVVFRSACQPGALDVRGGYIYWTDWCALNAIHRMDLDGMNRITGLVPVAGGEIEWLTVDDHHIYWGAYQKHYIGRANLDGSDPDKTFITTDGVPSSLAVDPLVGNLPAVSVAASPTRYGAPLSVTATAAGAGKPGGTVQFRVDGFDDGDPVPLDEGGHATYAPDWPVDAGSRMSAFYNGDRHFSSQVSDTIAPVLPARTKTSLGYYRQANGLWQASATVTNADSPVVPFGKVSFYVDGFPVGKADLDEDGRAQLPKPFTQATAATLTARYHDDTAAVPDFTDSVATADIAVPPRALPPEQTLRLDGAARPRRDGTIAVPVATNQAGLFSAIATTSQKLPARARRRGSTWSYGKGRLRATGPGRYLLLVRPNSRARRVLRRGGRLKLRILVSFRPRAGLTPEPQLTRAVVTGHAKH